MTTIVYRDGVLAADSRAYRGDKSPLGTKVKIHRLPDGSMFGSSSNCVGADTLLRRWVEEGCPPQKSGDIKPDSFEMILIRPNGEVFFAHDNFDLSGPLEAPFFAIGSGEQYALGALEMGADAVKAVEVACKLDVWSGGPLTVINARHIGYEREA
jgi:ATP-dependent protease HslVU (ClpYQ) peptidase subunit